MKKRMCGMRDNRIALVRNILVAIVLLASIGTNLYFVLNAIRLGNYDSMVQYLQTPQQMKIVYSGILKNQEQFREGEKVEIVYDFAQEEYAALLETYPIEEIAGDGSEYERAFRLMNEYARRLHHHSNFDNSVEMTALSLLEYGLDKKERGINCRCKAQILNEMLLALGIYSRKVWIMPESVYDQECHVVNEVWDTGLNKWVMMDITSNLYWVNEEGTPLSVLEIRQLVANQEFCTPVYYGDDCSDLEKSLNNNYGMYLYYLKNLVYMVYCDTMTVGESPECYYLLPENMPVKENMVLISESAVTASPQ